MNDQARRDRPAKTPGGMVCEECSNVFIGDEHHAFCGICIEKVAAKIATAQGR
jgi:hypothetical protein